MYVPTKCSGPFGLAWYGLSLNIFLCFCFEIILVLYCSPCLCPTHSCSDLSDLVIPPALIFVFWPVWFLWSSLISHLLLLLFIYSICMKSYTRLWQWHSLTRIGIPADRYLNPNQSFEIVQPPLWQVTGLLDHALKLSASGPLMPFRISEVR